MQSAAENLRDAQNEYLAEAPYEAPHSSMMDFTRSGWAIGEEAFLTVAEDEREGFIEAAVEAEKEHPLAAAILTAAAWDEVARMSASGQQKEAA